MSTITNELFTGGAASPPAAPKAAALGQADFMRLMTEQLKHQDPLKPLSNSEFIGQLAQFSTVQGISDLNTSVAGFGSALTGDQVLKGAALVECRLETGRTHQVRVHMASIGHPLVGDPVYGRTRKAHRELLKNLGFQRQALHAAHLGFIHPVTKGRLSFDSALPSDMQELFSALGV